MRQSLLDWTISVLEDGEGMRGLDVSVAWLGRKFKTNLGTVRSNAEWHAFETKLFNDAEFQLDVLDAALRHFEWLEWEEVNKLQGILEQSGSTWVARPGKGLERRLAEAATEAASEAMSPNDRASAHLSNAWNDVFGRNPDASDGYREAIRAVEAVAQPIIEPNNAKATLGTMIGALRSQPDKWSVGLHHPDPMKQAQDFAGTMDLLWKGQHDRHGTGDPDAPLDVSQEEAEAAVHLSVTLVQWFRSDVIQRR